MPAPPLFDILLCAATGIESPEMTHYDKMRALSMAGGKIETLTGVPPFTFKANGKPLISLSMLGNGQQSGTPTPDNPVTPEFVGVRTENLSPISEISNKYTLDVINVFNRAATNIVFDSGRYTFSINISTDSEYTGGQFKLCFTYTDGSESKSNWISKNRPDVSLVSDINKTVKSVSLTDFNLYIVISARFMINSGSTALPYEPFGYKIPITCGGTTTPVYTAEQETTRQIRKIAFNGTETGWQLFTASGVHQFYIDNALTSAPAVSGSSAVSNIAPYGATAANRASYQYGCYAVSSGNGIAFQMVGSAADFPDVTAWKAYLAEMSAAGNPVTVWYILANEQTGIINEPLCKIGGYADELHITDEVTIQTAKGNNVLTIDTTLQPTSVSITGHIRQT